jgi:hypothetical protein
LLVRLICGFDRVRNVGRVGLHLVVYGIRIQSWVGPGRPLGLVKVLHRSERVVSSNFSGVADCANG